MKPSWKRITGPSDTGGHYALTVLVVAGRVAVVASTVASWPAVGELWVDVADSAKHAGLTVTEIVEARDEVSGENRAE